VSKLSRQRKVQENPSGLPKGKQRQAPQGGLTFPRYR